MLFVLNVILGTLNLIPIPPLDGSRVLGGFLPRATYRQWAELDRYGNFVFIGLFLVMIAVPGFFDATFGAVLDAVPQPPPAGRVVLVTARRFEWRERDGVSWLAWRGGRRDGRLPGARRRRLGAALRQPQPRPVRGRRAEDVLENRRRLCAAVGLPPERLVVPGQVHGTTSRWVGEAEAGPRRVRQPRA